MIGDIEISRRGFLESGGTAAEFMILSGATGSDCGLLATLLGACPDDGDGMDMLRLGILNYHPSDQEMGLEEGEVALYCFKGDLYHKFYGESRVKIG